MRRIHPSDAGTTGPINVPPDPGDTHCYTDSSTPERPEDETIMHQDDASNHSHNQEDAQLVDEPMVQGTDPVTTVFDRDNKPVDNTVMHAHHHNPDVNGGIEDDNLLDIMANEVQALHNPTPLVDTSLLGPFGEQQPL